MLFIVGQSRTQKMLVLTFISKELFVSDVKSKTGHKGFKTKLGKVLQSQTKLNLRKGLPVGRFRGWQLQHPSNSVT